MEFPYFIWIAIPIASVFVVNKLCDEMFWIKVHSYFCFKSLTRDDDPVPCIAIPSAPWAIDNVCGISSTKCAIPVLRYDRILQNDFMFLENYSTHKWLITIMLKHIWLPLYHVNKSIVIIYMYICICIYIWRLNVYLVKYYKQPCRSKPGRNWRLLFMVHWFQKQPKGHADW